MASKNKQANNPNHPDVRKAVTVINNYRTKLRQTAPARGKNWRTDQDETARQIAITLGKYSKLGEPSSNQSEVLNIAIELVDKLINNESGVKGTLNKTRQELGIGASTLNLKILNALEGPLKFEVNRILRAGASAQHKTFSGKPDKQNLANLLRSLNSDKINEVKPIPKVVERIATQTDWNIEDHSDKGKGKFTKIPQAQMDELKTHPLLPALEYIQKYAGDKSRNKGGLRSAEQRNMANEAQAIILKSMADNITDKEAADQLLTMVLANQQRHDDKWFTTASSFNEGLYKSLGNSGIRQFMDTEIRQHQSNGKNNAEKALDSYNAKANKGNFKKIVRAMKDWQPTPAPEQKEKPPVPMRRRSNPSTSVKSKYSNYGNAKRLPGIHPSLPPEVNARDLGRVAQRKIKFSDLADVYNSSRSDNLSPSSRSSSNKELLTSFNSETGSAQTQGASKKGKASPPPPPPRKKGGQKKKNKTNAFGGKDLQAILASRKKASI